jgi:hypothetical protein
MYLELYITVAIAHELTMCFGWKPWGHYQVKSLYKIQDLENSEVTTNKAWDFVSLQSKILINFFKLKTASFLECSLVTSLCAVIQCLCDQCVGCLCNMWNYCYIKMYLDWICRTVTLDNTWYRCFSLNEGTYTTFRVL